MDFYFLYVGLLICVSGVETGAQASAEASVKASREASAEASAAASTEESSERSEEASTNTSEEASPGASTEEFIEEAGAEETLNCPAECHCWHIRHKVGLQVICNGWSFPNVTAA